VEGLIRQILGTLLALALRAWLVTVRVRVHGAEVLSRDSDPGAGAVLAFFHGTQLLLHKLGRRGRTCVMVSHSKDGELQAAALATLGFEVVRGSSSRGGARALAAMVRRLREPGTDAVFAVDGPRGPYGVVKPGAIALARGARVRVIPSGAAAKRCVVLERAWDRFVLPWPFTRVDIFLGDPVDLREGAEDRLARAIAECNQFAERACA
jgi:lysophospholipid acyltransferase (LPLAT)-like uncharacterized protein